MEYHFFINGQESFTFQPSRRIRQGDPLSPYLYILAANVLSCRIAKAEEDNQWQGIKICEESSPISHLFYADDSLLFLEANETQFQVAKSILEEFSLWTRQKINFTKSSLIFSLNTNHELRTSLSRQMGMNFSRRLGKYLGTQIDPGRNKSAIYNQILSAINSRTASWKEKLLSQTSRLTLIKNMTNKSYTLFNKIETFASLLKFQG